jgi:RNA polymerase sigma-B factor
MTTVDTVDKAEDYTTQDYTTEHYAQDDLVEEDSMTHSATTDDLITDTDTDIDTEPVDVTDFPPDDADSAATSEDDEAEEGASASDSARPKRSTRTEHDRERARALFGELADPATPPARRRRVRDELAETHLPLVEYLARRFAGRSEPLDDLVQVGTIGLIKAIDRFELGREVEFSTYATPTIVGEIKRHFRDKGWMVRVPRRLQERRAALTAATSDLTHRLGRSPTIAELAQHLELTEEEILEGLESSNAYTAVSLEATTDPDGQSIADTLGDLDADMEHVEYRESLKPLLAALPERERAILTLRFFANQTQSQIATQVGISQMHVSRLLARTLANLREQLLTDD